MVGNFIRILRTAECRLRAPERQTQIMAESLTTLMRGVRVENEVTRRLLHTSSRQLFNPIDPMEAEDRRRGKGLRGSVQHGVVKHTNIFDHVPPETKDQEAFEKAIGLFRQKNVHLRGHVEFIYAAMKRMKEFNVHDNLDVYKKLIDLFPKGKMVVRNVVQAEAFFYPKQQDCCVMLLDQMNFYHVHLDKETYKLVESIFGRQSVVMKKVQAMLYWMPKFKHLNPYPFPKPLPNSDLEVARITMQRMCRDPGNVISVYFSDAIPGAKEDTWIVSGQSPLQKDHLKQHPENEAIFVDGPYRVWTGKQSLSYFTLTAEPSKEKFYADLKPEDHNLHTAEEWANYDNKYTSEFPHSRRQLMLTPTIHEQPDGTILALVITGSASKESLAYWITFLQEENPHLKRTPVVFRISSPTGELVVPDGAKRFAATKNMVDTDGSS